MNDEEDVIAAGASEAGVHAVTQRGAAIGLELILTDEDIDVTNRATE
ncbi:MAG: hypothetical protein L0G94_10655 [Brachybacterium sp.]|nr:hypothetical protein [Brachybacterium sp.]MDN5687116.1 hypothetical protein [Brachybacterium sp.]